MEDKKLEKERREGKRRKEKKREEKKEKKRKRRRELFIIHLQWNVSSLVCYIYVYTLLSII